jgi:hypothetical protein
MNTGKILKLRPGRDANCSAMDYLGGVLVGFVAYMALLVVLSIVHAVLRSKGVAAKLGKRMVWVWVPPQAAVLIIFLIWAFQSGAMEYGSVICVVPLALIMLIGMVVSAIVSARSVPAEK